MTSSEIRLGPQAALIKLIGETPNPKDQKLLFSTRAAIAQAIIDAGWRPPESADLIMEAVKVLNECCGTTRDQADALAEAGLLQNNSHAGVEHATQVLSTVWRDLADNHVMNTPEGHCLVMAEALAEAGALRGDGAATLPPKGGSGVTPPRRLAEPRNAIQDYYQ